MRVHANIPNVTGLPDETAPARTTVLLPVNAPQYTHRVENELLNLCLYAVPALFAVFCFLVCVLFGDWHPPMFVFVSFVSLPLLLFSFGCWQYRCCRRPLPERNRWQRYGANMWFGIDSPNFSRTATNANKLVVVIGMMLMLLTAIAAVQYTTVVVSAEIDKGVQAISVALAQAENYDTTFDLNAQKLARRVSSAQERYSARHGRYASSFAALRTVDSKLPSAPDLKLVALDGQRPGYGWMLQTNGAALLHTRNMKPGTFVYPRGTQLQRAASTEADKLRTAIPDTY